VHLWNLPITLCVRYLVLMLMFRDVEFSGV
jgi:hypothetical protein